MNKLTKLILATAILATSGFAGVSVVGNEGTLELTGLAGYARDNITVEEGGTLDIIDSVNIWRHSKITLKPGSILKIADGKEVLSIGEWSLPLKNDGSLNFTKKGTGILNVSGWRMKGEATINGKTEVWEVGCDDSNDYWYYVPATKGDVIDMIGNTETGTFYKYNNLTKGISAEEMTAKVKPIVDTPEVVRLVLDTELKYVSDGTILVNDTRNLSSTPLNGLTFKKLGKFDEGGFYPPIDKSLSFIKAQEWQLNGGKLVVFGESAKDIITEADKIRTYLLEFGMYLSKSNGEAQTYSYGGGLRDIEAISSATDKDALFVDLEEVSLTEDTSIVANLHSIGEDDLVTTFKGESVLTLSGNNALLNKAIFECETNITGINSVPKNSKFMNNVNINGDVTLGSGVEMIAEKGLNIASGKTLTIGSGAKLVYGKKKTT